jgi:dihydroxyacetone kinase-like protein
VSDAVTQEGVAAWLHSYAQAVAENCAYLTDLDAAIGDADHGSNMDRGMQAVVGRLEGLGEPGGAGEPERAAAGDVGALLKAVGMTLVSTVGGAAGPLYGTLFLDMGRAAGGAEELTVAQWAAVLEAGVKGVQARGKAELGDKTMIDALRPAAEALRAAASSGLSLADALQGAAEAAEQGMKATIPLVARKGRASYLGERSAGHQDPGATSSWLLMQAAAEALASGAPADRPGT